MEKIVTEHQTMLALYHWGRTLQGKVGSIIPILIGSKKIVTGLYHFLQLLRIWFLYVKEKRRQEKRYLVAMDEYRSHLLVTGVTQWIEVRGHVMSLIRCCMMSPI